MQIDRALRRQVDLVGVAGQIVLRLVVAVADGEDRFAAVAELAQRFADIAQRRLVGAGEVIQLQHHAGNVFVVFGLADAVYHVEQRVFLQAAAGGAQQLAAPLPYPVVYRRLIDHHAA